MEYTAYDVKAKKKVKVQNPKVVKMKNGRYAVTGTSSASVCSAQSMLACRPP